MGSLTLAMAILILLGSGGMASGQANAPPATPVALTVARMSNETNGANPLTLPHVLVDVGDRWDRIKQVLNVPFSSIYFFHLNAAARDNQKVNLTLEGAPAANIMRNSNTHNSVDTTSLDIIAPVSEGQSIYLRNAAGSHLFSDSGKQTSFTAFDLQSHLGATDREIFCVAMQSPMSVTGVVPFAEIIVDTQNSWNANTNMFEIKQSGIYFLSFSAGLQSSVGMRAQIRKTNSPSLLTELWRESFSHNGTDVLSKVIMANLTAGDSVYIDLLAGELYSDTQQQTSFCGFRYDPASGNQIAWSIYRTSTYLTTDEPLDPLPFPNALLNMNDIFNFTDNRLYVSQPGLYYVQLTISAQTYSPVDVFLVNEHDFVTANIWKASTSHNGPDSSSTGMLLELPVPGQLRVILGPNSMLYSDMERQVTFTGFLLDPYPYSRSTESGHV